MRTQLLVCLICSLPFDLFGQLDNGDKKKSLDLSLGGGYGWYERKTSVNTIHSDPSQDSTYTLYRTGQYYRWHVMPFYSLPKLRFGLGVEFDYFNPGLQYRGKNTFTNVIASFEHKVLSDVDQKVSFRYFVNGGIFKPGGFIHDADKKKPRYTMGAGLMFSIKLSDWLQVYFKPGVALKRFTHSASYTTQMFTSTGLEHETFLFYNLDIGLNLVLLEF